LNKNPQELHEVELKITKLEKKILGN
jgi:hypothetical protein